MGDTLTPVGPSRTRKECDPWTGTARFKERGRDPGGNEGGGFVVRTRTPTEWSSGAKQSSSVWRKASPSSRSPATYALA
jgi:hypothetical protein